MKPNKTVKIKTVKTKKIVKEAETVKTLPRRIFKAKQEHRPYSLEIQLSMIFDEYIK